MSAPAWRELMADPGAERHLVQLYREPGFLARAVGAWVAHPLSRGGGAVLIGTPEGAAAVRAWCDASGFDAAAWERSGRLLVLDARATMDRFLRDGMPRAELFKPLAREAFARVRAACGPGAEVRAWGEMVNLLWHEGRRDASRSLEALWNEVIDEEDVRLLCSYALDNLDERTHAEGALEDVCAGHSRLLPEEDPDAFDAALSAALVDVFGEEEAGLVRAVLARRRTVPTEMPAAEAVLVALRHAQPDAARRVLLATRARLRAMAP